MTEHLRYQHVERFGTPEVEGIEDGEVWVFPKLDGTNASLWVGDDLNIYAGSRGRVLSAEADNHGFWQWMQTIQARELQSFFSAYPKVRLFGEWLVPHTFKHYREDAWRRFYVFDVWGEETQRWVPYEEYAPLLRAADIDVIDPLARMVNPTEEQLRKLVESNTYLVQDGAGPGEGIVLKRYDFVNRYGRPTWAKIVRNEFKEENRRAFGTAEIGEEFQVEIAIAQEFVTATLVAKERAKIEMSLADGVQQEIIDKRKLIPRLLETIYHCVVTEELWAALKKHPKHQVIDFARLRRHVYAQTKRLAQDLF
jgi:ATP-dependent RNA circularization protein (DNA/RNA ligase family)